jgi:hypothetical protein
LWSRFVGVLRVRAKQTDLSLLVYSMYRAQSNNAIAIAIAKFPSGVYGYGWHGL